VTTLPHQAKNGEPRPNHKIKDEPPSQHDDENRKQK
jgi:hypothetical protein